MNCPSFIQWKEPGTFVLPTCSMMFLTLTGSLGSMDLDGSFFVQAEMSNKPMSRIFILYSKHKIKDEVQDDNHDYDNDWTHDSKPFTVNFALLQSFNQKSKLLNQKELSAQHPRILFALEERLYGLLYGQIPGTTLFQFVTAADKQRGTPSCSLYRLYRPRSRHLCTVD